MTSTKPWAIIVGGGPSGLLLGLLLARRGIPVQILELMDGLDERPRATHYAPPAVYEFRRAGVLEDLRKIGFTPNGVSWRKLDGTRLAGMDFNVLKGNPDEMLCLPLDKVGRVLCDHLKREPLVTISYSHKVTSLGQTDDEAWVEAETPEGPKRLTAQYIIGCDGANSKVRRCLFGEKNFPGKTWDEQIVATNTYYDFYQFGFDDSQFFIHPEHWYMAAKITTDGLWRVTYGEIAGISNEEMRARQPWKFETMLPGHPKPHEYNMVNFSPYKVHQRIAESMRVGRVLLAADAAHLCNPFGGLGLTGGIVDVGGLFDCLAGVFEGKADQSILDTYNEVRRAKYNDIINPISSENIVRLFGQDPDKAMENDEFLKMCKRSETDLAFAKEMQLGINGIMYDFTQHYNGMKLVDSAPAGKEEGHFVKPVAAVSVSD